MNRNRSHFVADPHDLTGGVSTEIKVALNRCLKQIAQGLKFLHSVNIIHRDIKPGNILWDSNGNWKISDLGLAKLASTSMTPATGTPPYFAPEQWNTYYDSKVDIFAFGLVVFEVCYPMTGYGNHLNCFNGLRNSPPKFPSIVGRLPNYSAAFDSELITGMTKRNPDERMTIDQVITFLNTYLP